jgi:iron-sulfur cluster repair protein YtfE (RIC family)
MSTTEPTSKPTSEPATGRIDFTLMYATHDAFRRDLARLQLAASMSRTGSVGPQTGWANFKRQLAVHHTVEDEALWPRVAEASPGHPGAAEVLAAMEAEHGGLDALLEAVDTAMAARAAAPKDVEDAVAALKTALENHMRHEEEAALPLIQEVLEVKDWEAFGRAMARKQKLSGAAAYVPWVLDGANDKQRDAFFAAMPAPVKVVNRLVWDRRYRRRHPWA